LFLLSSLITHMNVIKQECKPRRYRKRKKREHCCLSCVIYPQILSRTEYKTKLPATHRQIVVKSMNRLFSRMRGGRINDSTDFQRIRRDCFSLSKTDRSLSRANMIFHQNRFILLLSLSFYHKDNNQK
jgi:hypothetical protein